MKKSKGFTLTEILAVIVILAILVGIGTPVYVRISSNVKTNEYNSKVSYIKSQAMKYAEEQNIEDSQTITVSTLIANGYIVADRYDSKNGTEVPFVTNPTDVTDNLACNLISINVDGYDYTVDFKKEQNCELLNENATLSEMNIVAYKYNGTTILTDKKIENGGTTSFNWVNTDVALAFSPKTSDLESITLTHNGESRTIDRTKMCATSSLSTACSNVEIVSASSLIKDEVTITANYKNTVKTITVEVKIDKEDPTVTSAFYDGWTKKDNKSITAYINDGSGSGAAGVYLTDANYLNPSTETRHYNVSNNGAAVINTELENKTYYLWAEDKAGNIAKKPKEIVISTVDKNAPSCTLSGMNYSWTRNPVTINWGCHDEESGCDPNYSGGSITFYENNQTINEYTISAYTIKDNAGNVTTCPSKTVKVLRDTQAPECPVSGEKTYWTATPVTIYYGCEDSGSGCATPTKSITFQETKKYESRLVEYQECTDEYDGKSWYTVCWPVKTYQNTSVPDQQVIKTSVLSAYEVSDNLGNSRTCYPGGKTLNIYYDHKQPEISAISNPKTWNRSPYNTADNLRYSDSDSGIASVTCSPANTSEYNSEGQHKVVCTAKDNVGNTNSISFMMYHEYPARYNPKTCTGSSSCNCHRETYCPCGYSPRLVSADCGGYNCWSMTEQWRDECDCSEQSHDVCDTCYYNYDCSWYDCPDGGTLGSDHICRY